MNFKILNFLFILDRHARYYLSMATEIRDYFNQLLTICLVLNWEKITFVTGGVGVLAAMLELEEATNTP